MWDLIETFVSTSIFVDITQILFMHKNLFLYLVTVCVIFLKSAQEYFQVKFKQTIGSVCKETMLMTLCWWNLHFFTKNNNCLCLIVWHQSWKIGGRCYAGTWSQIVETFRFFIKRLNLNGYKNTTSRGNCGIVSPAGAKSYRPNGWVINI